MSFFYSQYLQRSIVLMIHYSVFHVQFKIYFSMCISSISRSINVRVIFKGRISTFPQATPIKPNFFAIAELKI